MNEAYEIEPDSEDASKAEYPIVAMSERGQKPTSRTATNHVSLRVFSGPYCAECLLTTGDRSFSDGGWNGRS